MIVVLSVLLIAGQGSTLPNPSEESRLHATSARMMHFYLAPHAEEFVQIQNSMKSELSQLEEDSNGAALLSAVFLARVNEKYGYPLLDVGKVDDEARAIVAHKRKGLAKYVLDDAAVDPGKLDIWWVSFFATGDTTYLDKILSRVGDVSSQSGVANVMITGAANWSVTANCRQHSAVLQYVKLRLSQTPPPPAAEVLKDIVAKAEKTDG